MADNLASQALLSPAEQEIYASFQALAYVIYVRRGEEPERDPVRFATFLLFFPHLVAGPILRASTLLTQLASDRRLTREDVIVSKTTISSLRRFKDDVAEVRAGLECGVLLADTNDIKAGYSLEVFEVEERARTL